MLLKRVSLRPLACLVVLYCALTATTGWAGPEAAVRLLRVSGCGGMMPAIQPLQHDRRLDGAAALWAGGASPVAAAVRSGYRARRAVGLQLRGTDDVLLQALRRGRCHLVADPSLHDVGVYRRGPQTWMVMASANTAAGEVPARTFAYAAVPGPAGATGPLRTSTSAARVLQLVNAVRASGTRCGGKSFASAPPLRGSGTLDGIAAEHALDMARHGYFEHVDLTGHTPADRVRAAGYREKLVGENIAYGPTSADEVVAGWLHSTGHCENIMDPRFTEMGLALAPGRSARRGLYWDQVLAQPLR